MSRVDLGDPQVLLRYVNLALRLLQTCSDDSGELALSSSKRLLAQRFDELNPSQINQLSETLGRLGLRTSTNSREVSGGLHFIRVDVKEVTMEQLLAGHHIPLQATEQSFSPQEVTLLLNHTLASLSARAGLPSPHKWVGNVSIADFDSVIDELMSLPVGGEVMHGLKRLGLYRIFTNSENVRICYVYIRPSPITEAEFLQAEALFDWPSFVPVAPAIQPVVQTADADPAALIQSLVEELEHQNELVERLKRRLAKVDSQQIGLENQLAEQREINRKVAANWKKLEGERSALRAHVKHLEEQLKHSVTFERLQQLMRRAGFSPDDLGR